MAARKLGSDVDPKIARAANILTKTVGRFPAARVVDCNVGVVLAAAASAIPPASGGVGIVALRVDLVVDWKAHAVLVFGRNDEALLWVTGQQVLEYILADFKVAVGIDGVAASNKNLIVLRTRAGAAPGQRHVVAADNVQVPCTLFPTGEYGTFFSHKVGDGAAAVLVV